MLGKYIDEHALAAELGLTVGALRKWRQRGYGPSATKFGKRVLYVRDDVQRFIEDIAAGPR